jgi:DnaJ-class molecular chaperone
MFTYKKDEDNLYTVLNVRTTATPKEIKLAYYKLAKKYHPDFN